MPLERSIVYGPVVSRRLGISLGVNLLPTHCKVCSFDCVYCHYGPTAQTTTSPPVQDLPWPGEVVRAVEVELRRCRTIDCITFSGNGEPTLHPAFLEIAGAVHRLRDRLCPNVRLALFSNATTLGRPEVAESIGLFEAPMMKLDAGDPGTFSEINRPAEGVGWDDLVAGLRHAPGIHIQSVLIGGAVTNAKGRPLEAWMQALGAIRPAQVHIHSTDYPVAQGGVERIPPFELARIARDLTQRTGLQAEARWVRV